MKRIIRSSLARAAAGLPLGVLVDEDHFDIFQSSGAHITRVYFGSPIPNTSELDASIFDAVSELRGIDKNLEGQTALLREISSLGYLDEFRRLPEKISSPHAYSLNGTFGGEDGALLYSVIRKFRPLRMIEIGAGQSTLLSNLALKVNGAPTARFTTIDPYPPHYLKDQGGAGFELIEKRVECVPISWFDALEANDILFIDSSHAVRLGGDVLYEVLEILPRLKRGVLVHIHDIFLPRHYPKEWVMKRHIFWTEQYLMQAFLAYNEAFQIIWAYGIMEAERPDELAVHFPARKPCAGNGSSLWLRKLL